MTPQDAASAELSSRLLRKTQRASCEADLVVVGLGPAGLLAMIHGHFDYFHTVGVEGGQIGGQAYASPCLHNITAFPRGIGGPTFVQRTLEQVHLDGTTIIRSHATNLRRSGTNIVVSLANGREVASRAVILATGAAYKGLDIPSLKNLPGVRQAYFDAQREAQVLTGQEHVYIVGAGNSAGQVALRLAEMVRKVTILARRSSLQPTMGRPIIKAIAAAKNIEVLLNTLVVGGGGNGRLEELLLENRITGVIKPVETSELYVLIGGKPSTDWLPAQIARDEKGFILTGHNLTGASHRTPLPLETGMSQVFAVGDSRSNGASKGVIRATGEGSAVIAQVHECLRTVA